MSSAASAEKHRAEGGRAASSPQPIEPLVRRTLAREPGAWEALWLVLDPTIENLAGRWRVAGRLAACADARRDIVVRVMEKLRADGFRRLGKLHAALQRGEDAGRAWIAVTTRREAIDHVREYAEYLGAAAGEGGSRWAALVQLPDGIEDQLPDSVRALPAVAAGEIAAYAEARLPPEQLRVLRLWLTGYEPAEMIGLLGVDDGKVVVNLLNRALENLRYRFAACEIVTGRRNSFGGLGPGRRLKRDEVARSAGMRPGRAGDQVTHSKT
jgi:DNA-directed RNA polymerase specialized sigma24 family protein